MESVTNGIHPSLSALIKSPIEKPNLTISQSASITTEKMPILEHVETMDLRNIHNSFSRLGYGNLSDMVTQTMLCAIIVGALLLIVIGYLFIRQIPFILRHTPTKYMARTLTLCSIYLIVGAAAFVSLIAYRAFVFCDSVCHFAFLLCAYQYFTLIIDYADGETNFMKHTNGLKVFNMQTPPLCCCLRFLLPTAITKEKFKYLRLMVLQMPIIQGIFLSLLNVFNSIDTQLYEQMLPYIMVFVVTSILTGVWSLQITSRMIAKHLPEHKIMQKFFAIQLVLILYKFQPALIHGFCYGIYSTTGYQISSKVIENAIIHLIILLETTFLAYFANHAYSVPTKSFQPN